MTLLGGSFQPSTTKDIIVKTQKPDDNTVDLFWMLLRTLEENLGKRAGPIDSELIRAAYRHFSKLSGKEMKPEYVKLSDPPNPQDHTGPSGPRVHPVVGQTLPEQGQ
jgi:hypothetical protein